jgi:hypothetical protein
VGSGQSWAATFHSVRLKKLKDGVALPPLHFFLVKTQLDGAKNGFVSQTK